MSTIFDDLIEVVKAHPIIYDIRMKGYQKRGSRREKAWQAIAKCMQQRGHDINGDCCFILFFFNNCQLIYLFNLLVYKLKLTNDVESNA